MEFEAERYYRKAAENARDASVRELLIELAEAEAGHETLAHKLSQTILTKGAREKEDETARRMFMLQYVQPGLAGLMDGSVSTLAPLFAAAFATHNTWATFLVGMAASVGAGISMGVRRGPVGRRLAHRARRALAARHGDRRHDGARRARPHAALSHSAFPYRHRRVRSRWSRWSLRRFPGSARISWTRRSCRRRSRWWSAACWCSSPGY